MCIIIRKDKFYLEIFGFSVHRCNKVTKKFKSFNLGKYLNNEQKV